MRIATLCLCSIISLFGSQEPVAVSPHGLTVQFENDRIRILRFILSGRERSDMRSHPATLVVSLNASSYRILLPDGTHRDENAKPGDVAWQEASTNGVENLLSSPLENIEIEFKTVDSAAAADSSPHSAPEPASQSSSLPVQREPHHHLVFENEHVRVLSVEVASGESTLFHTHSHDNIAIRMENGLAQTQLEGQDWSPANPVRQGSVGFSEGSKKPYTHRVKNIAPTIFHVMDVELLP